MALVDACDAYLASFTWYLDQGRNTSYAYRKAEENEVGNWVRMHRQILGLNPGDTRQGDHVNRNGLDNRRSNLRIVTMAQQHHNRGVRADKKASKQRGVFLDRRDGRWYGQVETKGKKHGTGRFPREEEAAEAVRQLRLEVLSHAIN